MSSPQVKPTSFGIFATVKQEPVMTRHWLRQPEAVPFKQMLDEWVRQASRELVEASDLLQVGRAQGKLTVLHRLISLEKELDNL